MDVYVWKGKNSKGAVVKGEIKANDENKVWGILYKKKINSIKIKKKQKDILENIQFFQPKIKNSDVIIFARQFSTMIDAGLPIIQCLEILYIQQNNPVFKEKIGKIKESVESGNTLSESLQLYPKIFDDFFVNMVVAGETGGILDVILQRLSSHLEKMAKLKNKVKGAMTYPAVTLTVAIAVISIILVFVIPVFESMFADFGSTLPVLTRFVVDLSWILKENFIFILSGFIILLVLFKKIYLTNSGKKIIDNLILKMPLFGILIKKAAVAKFTRTTGTMISSGVAILDTLGVVAKTSGNKTIEQAVINVKQGIVEGRDMSSSLSESKVFPPMVCSMIAVGESTGSLDIMLIKIADFYDQEVEQAVENLTSMLEPFLMIVLGLIVGGLVISMYLPIFNMAAVIG